MNLLHQFRQFIQNENLFQSGEMLLVAVSGGVDSVVLCHLCKQAGYNFAIAHCNFQLRGDDSSRDENFVKALAEKYNVDFFVKKFDTVAYAGALKKSIEEAARDLRYEWFYSLINDKKIDEINKQKFETSNASYILTAHHADDNIETVLMNFFRGTGITGLRGILPKNGKIIRPLLFARRTELEAYIKENGLDYVTDHTNLESDYTRNYFRNKIIPLVSESFPAASKNVLNNIRRFRETEILYQQSVQLHKQRLLERKGEEIHIPVLKLIRATPLSTILFEILKDFGFTAHQTAEVITLLKSDTGKYIQSATHRVIKNRNWLIISPVRAPEASHILIEESDTKIIFKEGVLTARNVKNDDLLLLNDPLVAQLDLSLIQFPLLLRKWKAGDYFYPLGMQKKKKLGRFFTDQKLSLTQKENIWVIEMNRKIIWIVGMRIDDRFKITNKTSLGYSLSFLNSAHN